MSDEHGIYKTVNVRFWNCLGGKVFELFPLRSVAGNRNGGVCGRQTGFFFFFINLKPLKY